MSSSLFIIGTVRNVGGSEASGFDFELAFRSSFLSCFLAELVLV